MFIWYIVGIVLSPGTILLRSNDIKHRIKSAGAKLIIADVSSVDNVDQVIVIVWLIYLLNTGI